MTLLLLLACGTAGDKDTAGDTSAAAAPTWGADVAPIVERSCVGCHRAGGVGAGDFTTYAGAAPMANAMAGYVAGGFMPPPAMDPECRSYAGHERMVVPDADIATLQAWAAAGAPEGEPIGALEATTPTLEGADVELMLPVAHPVTPQDDGNEYHCQILDNPFTETTYITGFDVLVDQPGVVHHTVLAIDGGGDAGAWTGEADLTDGWDCRDRITEGDWEMLHAWAPGMEPTAFTEGLGLKVEPGDQLVLQMHYFGSDTDAGTLDQSGYVLRTADSVSTQIMMAPIGPSGFVLPADQVSTPAESYLNDFGVDVTVYGVFPHMHLLGAGYEATIETPSGEEKCLARADAWDFGHQATYLYDEPVEWEGGEILHTTCTFDNTSENPAQYNSPPEVVTYGEGTNQEMCFFLFYFSF